MMATQKGILVSAVKPGKYVFGAADRNAGYLAVSLARNGQTLEREL